MPLQHRLVSVDPGPPNRFFMTIVMSITRLSLLRWHDPYIQDILLSRLVEQQASGAKHFDKSTCFLSTIRRAPTGSD